MTRWSQLACGFVTAFACGVGCKESGQDECAIGTPACPCTQGGGCDPGLICASGVCVDLNGDGDGDGTAESDAGTVSSTQGDGDGDGDSSTAGDGDTGGKLDVGDDTGGNCNQTGCKQIDVLFGIDGSASMAAEINALKATQAFAAVVAALEDVNCGDIDYRIGVTDDNDHGFVVPNGWGGADPWFDSAAMTPEEIADAFADAAANVQGFGGADLGCEHVLTSSVDLLDGDGSGFVRADALLVLVYVTDVDDYGAYDQPDGNSCGLGCEINERPVADLHADLLAVKGGVAEGLAAIVVAGDPTINAGVNFCDQPGSCCGGFDCDVFHATRLWEFAEMMAGDNGYRANLCSGPQSVPDAVESAFDGDIDLACQMFEPEG